MGRTRRRPHTARSHALPNSDVGSGGGGPHQQTTSCCCLLLPAMTPSTAPWPRLVLCMYARAHGYTTGRYARLLGAPLPLPHRRQ
jgi:hypothetical protein